MRQKLSVVFTGGQRNIPVPIRFGETEEKQKGYYSNKRKEIVVKENMSESQTIKHSFTKLPMQSCMTGKYWNRQEKKKIREQRR